nr:MAG TPA: hypothetical protein [Caudoviricetes sp.]
MAKISQYELSDKQIEACKEIERAFKKALKAGLCFYGKGGSIVAYKHSAMKHAAPSVQLEGGIRQDRSAPIPGHTMGGCIIDSGADDDEYFEEGFID